MHPETTGQTGPQGTPVDEATLVDLFHRAHKYAAKVTTRELAEDLAQDVVLEALIRLRAGTLTIDDTSIGALARSMVERRAVDALRRAQRRLRRDAEHASDLWDSKHGWMSPALAHDEGELWECRERLVAELPSTCRRAYVMVREDRASYKEAAAALGVSASAVCGHVVGAQRRLRRELGELGFETDGGRTAPALVHACEPTRARVRKRTLRRRADECFGILMLPPTEVSA